MFIAYLIVALVLALALTGSAIGKFARAQQVVTLLRGVGVPLGWFPALAACELAGAIGLVVGLWLAPIGEAAAAGVIGYFIGAVIFHVRANDRTNLGPPVALGLLGVAALVLRVLSM